MENNLDHVFKILLIGDAGVGKSSILLQFTDGYFNDNLQSTIGLCVSMYGFIRAIFNIVFAFPNIGVDFKVKVMDATGPDGRPKRVKVTIWDTGEFIYSAQRIVMRLIRRIVSLFAAQLVKNGSEH